MPRKTGYKHLQKTRDKIQGTSIVNRMNDHVMADEDIMSQSQVNAAKALLNKVLPDLRSTELTGEGGGPILLQAMNFADGPDDASDVSE